MDLAFNRQFRLRQVHFARQFHLSCRFSARLLCWRCLFWDLFVGCGWNPHGQSSEWGGSTEGECAEEEDHHPRGINIEWKENLCVVRRFTKWWGTFIVYWGMFWPEKITLRRDNIVSNWHDFWRCQKKVHIHAYFLQRSWSSVVMELFWTTNQKPQLPRNPIKFPFILLPYLEPNSMELLCTKLLENIPSILSVAIAIVHPTRRSWSVPLLLSTWRAFLDFVVLEFLFNTWWQVFVRRFFTVPPCDNLLLNLSHLSWPKRSNHDRTNDHP